MVRSLRVYASVALLVMLMFVSACGGDDDDSADSGAGSDATTAPASPTAAQGSTASADDANTPSSSGGSAATGGGAGALTLGDEVVELDSARCYLQEQDVAGSPGKILFNAQGFGTLGSGEDFIVDVSRYDEDSLFTGDDIEVEVGDPFGEDFYSWLASADLGTIERDGSTLRAEGLTFVNSENGEELNGALELNC